MDHDPDASFNRNPNPEPVIQSLIEGNNWQDFEDESARLQDSAVPKERSAIKVRTRAHFLKLWITGSVLGRQPVDVNEYTYRDCKRILGRAATSAIDQDNVDLVLHFNAIHSNLIAPT